MPYQCNAPEFGRQGDCRLGNRVTSVPFRGCLVKVTAGRASITTTRAVGGAPPGLTRRCGRRHGNCWRCNLPAEYPQHPAGGHVPRYRAGLAAAGNTHVRELTRKALRIRINRAVCVATRRPGGSLDLLGLARTLA